MGNRRTIQQRAGAVASKACRRWRAVQHTACLGAAGLTKTSGTVNSMGLLPSP